MKASEIEEARRLLVAVDDFDRDLKLIADTVELRLTGATVLTGGLKAVARMGDDGTLFQGVQRAWFDAVMTERRKAAFRLACLGVSDVAPEPALQIAPGSQAEAEAQPRASVLDGLPADDRAEAAKMIRDGKGARDLVEWFGWELSRAQEITAALRAEMEASP